MSYIIEALQKNAEKIDALLSSFAQVDDQTFQEVIDYALSPPVHRERPFLMRLACESVGGSFDKIIPAAIGIELFHLSTLVIDDVLDHAPMRGGKASVLEKYGMEVAITAGEILRALAGRAILGLEKQGHEPNAICTVLGILEQLHGELYVGQYLDLYFEGQNDVTEEAYLDMIDKTTGSLLSATLEIGALLGSGQLRQVAALSNYGRLLGRALQIRDDLVELVFDQSQTGKQIGGDIRQGKKRLPVIYALTYAEDEVKQLTRTILEARETDEATIKKAIQVLASSGAIDYCESLLQKLCEAAKMNLKDIPGTRQRRLLMDFADLIGHSW